MRGSRRRLLAAIGTGLATGIAGCGYAPGGGDVRRDASLLTGIGGPVASNRFDVEGDRIAAAKSGQQWIGEFGDRSFETATTVRITDRDAEEIGEFVHLEPSLDLTLGERLVLLDEAGRLVATEPIEDREDADDSDDLEEAWRTELDDPGAPIAAAEGTAYVPDGNRLLAVRDGTVIWERSLAGTVETLQAQDGVVLTATESTAVALDPDGGARWEFEIDGPATFAVDRDLTVLRARGGLSGDDTDLVAIDTGTGDVRWSTTVQGRDARPAIADGRVHVVVHGTVTAYDRETGDRRWETEDVGAAPPIVAGREGVYSLGENCEAIGVDSDGRRWSRTLDRGSCSVVDGWIDGETVAFLLAAGGIVWVQRVDEEPGLLG